MTGGDLIADVLARQGVRFLFTLCGGHISPILVSARARGIRVVDTRHEATAVFAADAVARLSGVPGVAAVTAGPGVTNTITALKNSSGVPGPVFVECPVVLLYPEPTVREWYGAKTVGRPRGLARPSTSPVLARTDYERAAAGLGAHGLRLDDPARAESVFEEARRVAGQGRPVYVNALLSRTDFRRGSISI